MALHPEIISVDDIDEVDAVLEVMERFTSRGRGWINVQPDVAPDAAPSNRSALMQFFRRNSPEAALGTWLAPASTQAPQSIGIQHAFGTRIGPHLEEWESPLGEGWRRVQDSPRRGLLIEVPASERHATVLQWLLAVTMTATVPKTIGTWSVSVYEGRSA